MSRAALVLALAAVALGPAAGVADPPAPFVARGELVGGHDYTYWLLRGLRRGLGEAYRPVGNDTTCEPGGQDGPVWFTVGHNADGHVNTVTCSVPAGLYLLVAGGSLICTDLYRIPGYGDTSDRGLERCARSLWHREGDHHPRLLIDGTPVEPAGVYVATHAFGFRVDPHANFFGTRRRHGRAATAGIVALLRPLPPGQHKIVLAFRLKHSYNRVQILRLTVT